MSDLELKMPFIPPQPSAGAIPTADIRLPTNSGDVRHADLPPLAVRVAAEEDGAGVHGGE